jgi:hypothetical protein
LQSDCGTERRVGASRHDEAMTPGLALSDLPIPRHSGAETIAVPADRGPGHWVGAASVLVSDGVHYLAYRTRRPVDDGRGGDVIVARLGSDGSLTELCRVDKASMDAESLERPALVVDGAGAWRLYLSCATVGTRHWRVEMLEAAAPDAFVTAGRRVVMPGDAHVGVKDPVIICDERGWRAWICCHPLDDPNATDRMWTEFASSRDGIAWTMRGPALQPTPRAVGSAWHAGHRDHRAGRCGRRVLRRTCERRRELGGADRDRDGASGPPRGRGRRTGCTGAGTVPGAALCSDRRGW